jgi:hypothetical protein
MPYANIPICTELEALEGAFDENTPAAEKEKKAEDLITKWVQNAEANNIQAEKFVTDARGKAQAAVDKMEKKLETIKAAMKKSQPGDFKVMAEFRNARKEVADLSAAVGQNLSNENLYVPMAEYRGNGWLDVARRLLPAPRLERFKKVRSEGMAKGTAMTALAERVYEYEERAALLMDEAGDLLIKTIADAEQKKAKIAERLTDILEQMTAKKGWVVDTHCQGALSKKNSMDAYLATNPPTAQAGAMLETYLAEVQRQVKTANGKLKTLKMQRDHIESLCKGHERHFANQIKQAKDIVKEAESSHPQSSVKAAEEFAKKYAPKVEAFLKRLGG